MYDFLTNDLKIFAKHLNVLIVEDEKSLATEMKELLSLFFNKVYHAIDGEEGLEFYKKYKCDIVITDLNMPKKNGIELSRQIRIWDRNQVIIVLSGHIDTFVIDLIDIGIQTLLIKPYEIDKFLQKLLVQCENIVLRKEFEKIKLNIALGKNVLNTKENEIPKKINEDMPVLKKLVQEVIDNKPKQTVIKDYLSNFNVEHEIDDSMWKHISIDIQELNEFYEENINKIALNGLNDEIKDNLIKIFNRYHSSLLHLSGLNDLAEIFLELVGILEDIEVSNLNEDSLEFFDIFEYFYEDIIKFFNIVFIDKETKNINYLTDSMKSSVLQLKVKLGLENLEEEELEFF
jgi:DNA-binding response OmpR family regulator